MGVKKNAAKAEYDKVVLAASDQRNDRFQHWSGDGVRWFGNDKMCHAAQIEYDKIVYAAKAEYNKVRAED